MNCPNCGAEMKYINAGISKKTGKPYGAFYSCPDCKKTAPSGEARIIPQKQTSPFDEVMHKKEQSIASAQARKEESMRIQGAKRDAGLITAAMIQTGELKGSDWRIKYKEIAEYIVNYNPEDITVDERPF